ncbi:MAG: hypothetical protein KHY72_10175 [Streptococcus agalactiae]|nr:hypothetical protein [Streptococcus agalactiae]
MAIRPFNFYVEMEKNDYTPVGEVKQLDTMELDIKVLENGVPKNLESSEIALYIRKKDGTILEQKDNINVVEASEGAIKIKVKNQATACVGMTLFELELKGADGIATTGTFIFIVNERVVNGEVVESKDEIHALVEVEKYVKLAKEELQRFKELQTEMLRTNETINSNEEGRASAEEKRVNAEKKRALAEEGRGTLFTQKEEERGTLFAQKELDRNNTFTQGERERNERFEEAERNRAVAESERVIAEQERKEKFAGFENKINVNTEELEGARTATTGEQFNSLDERIDCEVDRLNKKIEVSMLQQEDKESHTIENTVEGITTDMVIKGKTLQNLFEIELTNEVDTKLICFNKLKEIQQASKKYTLINNTNLFIEYQLLYKDSGLYKNTIGVDAGSIKIHTLKENEVIGRCEGLKKVGWTSSDLEKLKRSCFILEGDWTSKPIPQYFEGIKSFGQQEDKISILSSGKNFFKSYKSKSKGNTSIFNIENDNVTIGTNQSPSWTNASINYGKLKIGSKYTVSCESFTGGVGDKVLFAVKKYRGREEVGAYGDITKNSLSLTFTVVDDADIVLRFFVNNTTPINTPTSITYNNIQIVEGDKTDYTPSIIDKKDILLQDLGFNEGLRGLNNSAYDELNSVRNVAVKRIDKYTFIGDEGWTLGTQAQGWGEFEDSLIFYLDPFQAKPNTRFICDKFAYKNVVNIDEVGIYNNVWGNKPHPVIRIKKSELSTPDLEGFKAWLKANPTTIYYELAEPLETPLNDSIAIKVYDEKTYIAFENSISGTSSFKAPVDTVLTLSNLTDDIRNKADKKEADEINERATESLELSEYNHSDINDNIFPYIMDIELMVLDMLSLNGYTNKKYKIMERAGINMTSKQALERLIRQKKVTLEDALDRIVRYNDAGRITDAEALELTDLANEIL